MLTGKTSGLHSGHVSRIEQLNVRTERPQGASSGQQCVDGNVIGQIVRHRFVHVQVTVDDLLHQLHRSIVARVLGAGWLECLPVVVVHFVRPVAVRLRLSLLLLPLRRWKLLKRFRRIDGELAQRLERQRWPAWRLVSVPVVLVLVRRLHYDRCTMGWPTLTVGMRAVEFDRIGGVIFVGGDVEMSSDGRVDDFKALCVCVVCVLRVMETIARIG